MNVFQQRSDQPWPHYTFKDILKPSEATLLNDIDASQFFSSHTTSDEKEENYDEKGLKYHYLQADNIINKFKEPKLVSNIQDKLNVDLRLQGMSVMLVDVVDSRPEWVHVDDPNKLVTIVIYLGSRIIKKLGTWFYSNKETLSHYTDFIPNTGYIFKPSPNTWHSIPEIISIPDSVRRTLMVNYVKIPNRLDMIKDPSLKVPNNIWKL